MKKNIAIAPDSIAQASSREASHVHSKRRTSVLNRKVLLGLILALPAFVFMAYSNFIPAVWDVILSFQKGGLLALKPTGFANYLKALHDPDFLGSLWNSVFLALVTTFFAMLIGILLALAIYRLGKMEGIIYRLIIFMPVMLPSAIVGLLFTFVYTPDLGLLNNVLRLIGASGATRAWLAQPPLNLYAICVVAIWKMVGLPMIFTYAALQSLPSSYLEAARLEGAGYMRQVRLIILPLLKPILGIAATFTLILDFKPFDLVYVLTRGGPAESTYIVPLRIIETAFTFDNFGYAASFGIIMAIVILVLNFGVSSIFKSEKYEY